MIDFSISAPRPRLWRRPKPVAAPEPVRTADGLATIKLRTNSLRAAYREIIAAEDDGLPIDVRESGTFLDTQLTITLTCAPSDRDRAAFVRLSQRLARFGPIALSGFSDQA